MPGTVLLSDLRNSRYMWDLHPLGVAMGEAGVTADLHGSSVTRRHLPPCLLLLEKECLSFLPDLPSPPPSPRGCDSNRWSEP